MTKAVDNGESAAAAMTSGAQQEERADARRELLRCWTAMERFGTTTLGRQVRSDRRVAVDLEPDQPLPWEPGHAVFGRRVASDKVEWRHTLHIGQFEIGSAYADVEAQFPEAVADADDERRLPRGMAPLLALTVTADGRPHVDSLQVSSAAWSIARTLRLGVDDPEWLTGFADSADQVSIALGRLMVEAADVAAIADGYAIPEQRVAALLARGIEVPDDAVIPAAEGLRSGLRGETASGAVSTRDLGADSNGSRGEAASGAVSTRDLRAGSDPAAGSDPGSDSNPSADVDTTLPEAPPAIDEDGIALMPLTWEVLMRLMALARKILELGDELTIRPVVRSTSWQQSRRAPLGSADTLLNSFTVTDLERVGRDLGAARGKAMAGPEADEPSALERYLDSSRIAESEVDERVDTGTDLAAVRERLHPSKTPAGRWPAAPDHDLALGQQLAVNLALDPDGPAIVAVNGPPGTGKTTMLRDMIAGVVTERAKALAELSKPDDLFTTRINTGGDERRATAHRVRASVAGRELLLACATNAAAQNVSLELPTRTAIAAEWAGRPGYLPDFATAALRAAADDDARQRGEEPADAPAPTLDFGGLGGGWGGGDGNRGGDGRGGDGGWGRPLDASGRWGDPLADGRTHRHPIDPTDAWALISARLGRRSYGKAFAEAIWWGTPAWVDRTRRPPVSQRVDTGLGALLMTGTAAEHQAAWEASRKRFLEALAAVDRVRDQRIAAADRLASPAELQARVEKAQDEVDRLHEHLERQLATREQLADAVAGNLKDKALVAAKRAIARVQSHDRRIEEAREQLAAAGARLDEERLALELRRAGAEDATPVGWVVPGERWEDDRDYRERRAPWSDEAWNAARTECFLAALDLHETTLRAAGRKARANLGVAFDLLSGRATGLPHDAVLAAWQTLFLLVPVISTTFASMPTLLSGLRAEDLGWLLVDEAGQAEPQQVVGGLWRCKRAVIVGDPMQLDPVTTLPGSLAEAIRVHHEVDEAYVGGDASVQRLADAVMPWGGHRGEDDLWVGVPMNVHRRCEGPIFDLVNAIAYGGRMLNATVERPAHRGLRVESCWLDVPAGWGGGGGAGGRDTRDGWGAPARGGARARGNPDGHWRPGEGVRLDALLAHLHFEGYDFGELFAVSPFRDVARQLDRRARVPEHRGMVGGTIHTIQGREADAVIVVLGGDPARPGARHWAASKPNLLNVAVSRARQRLYVIGDYEAWADLPHFRELSALRRVPPRG